jgi:AraC-like DNA-binding protein
MHLIHNETSLIHYESSGMEPLAALLSLLRPRAVAPKQISGAGRWGVRYGPSDDMGYGLVLAGRCHLQLTGGPALTLTAGDFVLLPPGPGFRMTSDPEVEPMTERRAERTPPDGEIRHGDAAAPADFRLLGGYFRCDPTNIVLLAQLMPAAIHIHATEPSAKRLADAIALIADEALSDRPGRELIVERLAEVLLVEALRFRAAGTGAIVRPGLLAGLADPALARALRRLHADVARPWTVAELARTAALSRSTFSERFTRRVGVPPMEYLLQWRMALARDLLQRQDPPLETVAAAVGYESASAFSTAFRKRMGMPPGRFRIGHTP